VEAGVSDRAWKPVVAAPFLYREMMARAAEAIGWRCSERSHATRPSWSRATISPSRERRLRGRGPRCLLDDQQQRRLGVLLLDAER
jgi:hypothetical protein